MNSYRSDIIVSIPYVISEKSIFGLAIGSEVTQRGDKAGDYLKMMNTVFSYECEHEVYALTSRYYIGSHRIECESDSLLHKKEAYGIDADLFIVASEKTSLAILNIVSLDNSETNVSFMMEELNRGNGKVKFWGDYIPIDKFMLDVYGMTRCGAMKFALTISDYPKDEMELRYLLAAEEYGTQEVDSSLVDNPLFKPENISQYTSVDFYVSNCAAVSVANELSEELSARLYQEALIQQIVEVTLFKLTAIERTNRKVLSALESGSLPEINLLDALASEFASTIRFWDTDNFIYLTTRNIAEKISTAFGSNEKMLTYERNRVMMEHLIEIRNAQSSEREERTISFLAIALTVIQLIPMFYGIFSFMFFDTVSLKEVISTIASCSTVALGWVIVMLLYKKNTKKNKF